MTQPGALVLGATYRALGVVRSLGRRGVPVRVVQTDDHVVAGFSRYTRGRLRLPGGDEAARAHFLMDLAVRADLDGWSLVPTDDDSAALVARHRDALAAYRVATPPWDVLRWAHDKHLTHQLGIDAGVPVPETWRPEDLDAVRSLHPAFPVILKPAVKCPGDPLSEDKAWRVDDEAELAARYEQARRTLPADAVIVQELIPGIAEPTQLSYGALCHDGRVLASITALRTRQRPMDFGKASTFVETIDDDEVARLGRRLIEHLRWTGILEVEFKRDPRDGLPKLLDLNPRTWGWQSLGAAAGVDFPWLEWLLSQGRPVPEAHADPGVRWLRLSTDLPTVASEVCAGRLSLRELARSYRAPVAFATWAKDDPRPAVLDLPALAAIAARRRLDRRRA